MSDHYQRIPSDHLGRRVHVWTHGHAGQPVLVFPSAAGMAHEWQHAGAVEALSDWIAAGRIQLFCPESNVSEAWTNEADPRWRLERHRAYERFIADEFFPWIAARNGSDRRLVTTGCSFGGFYAANLALKNPERVAWALCLSGRYRTDTFLDGYHDESVYFADPLQYVPNLDGRELERVKQTFLTLVVGRGPFEGRCLTETVSLSRALAGRGIPHHFDPWGKDVAHDWTWWKRQLRHHLRRVV